MKSWRFKKIENKVGTIMFCVGFIGITLATIIGTFIIHWTFGTIMLLIWLMFIGLFLAEE